MLRRSILRAVLVGSAAGAFMVPATALGAKPTPAGSYGQCVSNTCKINDITVSANGSKVVKFIVYTKCNPVPFTKFPVMKITPAGSFAFSGKVKDVLNHTISVTLKGTFVSASVVSGTVLYSTASCNSKALSYRAVLGKGHPQDS
jgi:hypothetical protein